jgi:hypothetical protein
MGGCGRPQPCASASSAATEPPGPDQQIGAVASSAMTTVAAIRAVALELPRSYEVLVRDQVKFRVGRIVYLAFSRDEASLGFAFPKEEREALVASEPSKFSLPGRADLRYNWAVVKVAAIDDTEMRELVIDAWRMVVPKRVAAEFLGE